MPKYKITRKRKRAEKLKLHHNLSWFEKNMYSKVSIIYGLFSKLKKIDNLAK